MNARMITFNSTDSNGWCGYVSNTAVSQFNRWVEANRPILKDMKFCYNDGSKIVISYALDYQDLPKLSTIMEEGIYSFNTVMRCITHVDTGINVTYMIKDFNKLISGLDICINEVPLVNIELRNGYFSREVPIRPGFDPNGSGGGIMTISENKIERRRRDEQHVIYDIFSVAANSVIRDSYLPEYMVTYNNIPGTKDHHLNLGDSNYTKFNISMLDGRELKVTANLSNNDEVTEFHIIDQDTGNDYNWTIISPYDFLYELDILSPLLSTVSSRINYVHKYLKFVNMERVNAGTDLIYDPEVGIYASGCVYSEYL